MTHIPQKWAERYETLEAYYDNDVIDAIDALDDWLGEHGQRLDASEGWKLAKGQPASPEALQDKMSTTLEAGDDACDAIRERHFKLFNSLIPNETHVDNTRDQDNFSDRVLGQTLMNARLKTIVAIHKLVNASPFIPPDTPELVSFNDIVATFTTQVKEYFPEKAAGNGRFGGAN
jgi:hypothetical protein